MSKEEILNLKPKRGIDIVFQPVKTNSNVYIATISGTDLNPSNPLEECEENDIHETINKYLRVYSDRVRNPVEMEKIPKIVRQMGINPNEKCLDGNKYDFLRSKAKKLPNNSKLVNIQEG